MLVTMIFAARAGAHAAGSTSSTEAAPQHPTGRKPATAGRMRQTVRSAVQMVGKGWKMVGT